MHKMEPKHIIIMKGSERLVLPIAPESFEVIDTWNNEELDINNLGLITMIGKRALKSVTITSFFPGQKYDFEVPDYYRKNDPWDYIITLSKWRGAVLSLVILETGDHVSWQCVIDGDFTYGQGQSGDVNYSITFKEYKKTSSKRTTNKNTKNIKYTTKKGDTVIRISRKYFGDTSRKKNIYNTNKKALKKAFKKYMKKMSKANKAKYKKKSVYNKPLPKGVKLTIKP